MKNISIISTLVLCLTLLWACRKSAQTPTPITPDEIEEDWDLRGAGQITAWAREIIFLLGDKESLPDFKETSSFRRK